MGFLTAHALCTGSGPTPSRAALARMKAQLEQVLGEVGYAPLELETESWRFGAAEFVARIRVKAEPGERRRSFASFYEWAHPRWRWSHTPAPTVELGTVYRSLEEAS
jgi:hypothetical protein